MAQPGKADAEGDDGGGSDDDMEEEEEEAAPREEERVELSAEQHLDDGWGVALNKGRMKQMLPS